MKRKKRVIAISQPYYFPWLGACEIFFNSDAYVFFDDVNFQKRGLNNRVKCKTENGSQWLTVPLKSASQNKKINEIELEDPGSTYLEHRKFFLENYSGAKFNSVAIDTIDRAFAQPVKLLSELAINSEIALFSNFGTLAGREIHLSSNFNRNEKGSKGILEIVQMLQGDVYLTAHGALNYLDHEEFELNGIEVRYMNYGDWDYGQLFEGFDRFVSGLDAIACLGSEAKNLLTHETLDWRTFSSLTARVKN